MQTIDKSDANTAIVQSLYAAFASGDLEKLYATASPDIVWESVGPKDEFPLFGARHGIDGMKDFFNGLAETNDFKEFTTREFHGSADKVFVLGHYEFMLKTTGQPVSSDWCHVFTVRDGKVSAFREFTDSAQVVAAARG